MLATVRTIVLFQISCILPCSLGRALATSQHSTNSFMSENPSIVRFSDRNPQNIPVPPPPSLQDSTGLEYPKYPVPPVFAIVLSCALVALTSILCCTGFHALKRRRREDTELSERVPGISVPPSSSPSSLRITSVQSISSHRIATYWPSAPPPPQATPISPPEDELICFKMNREKAADPCGICLEPFDTIDVTAGQCMHVFHTTCLKAWLAKEASQKLCPLCRNPFHGSTQETMQSILIRRSLESPNDLITSTNL